MKKRKILSVLLSSLLVFSGFAAPAFAAGGNSDSGTTSGTSTVETVTLNVVLPLNLNFALDPLQLTNPLSDNQVSESDYIIVNKTVAPVKVEYNLTATLGADVDLVTSVDELSQDDTSEKSKKVLFAALGASEIEDGITFDTNPGNYTTAAAITYNSKTDALSPFTVAEDKATATIAFALNKAEIDEISNTLAANGEGISAFQFYGQLNTYADWKADDIKVSGAYTITALRAATYNDLEPLDGGVNQLQLAPPSYNVTLTNDGKGTATSSPAKAQAGASVTLTPVASDGYVFDAWQVVSPSTLEITGNSFTMPAEAVSVKATFKDAAAATYNVTVTSGGNGTASSNVTTAKAGDTVTLTAAPASGYLFDKWEVVSPVGLTITTNSFEMPASAVSVNAVFKVNPSPPIGFTGETTFTYSKTTNTPTSIVVPFNFGGKTVTSLKIGTYAMALNTDYTVQSNSITITKSRIDGLSLGAKTFDLVVDGKTYSFTVTPTT